MAAQNCRRRKMEQIWELEEEVVAVRSRRERLVAEREELEEGRRRARERLERLEEFILASYGEKGWRIEVRLLPPSSYLQYFLSFLALRAINNDDENR